MFTEYTYRNIIIALGALFLFSLLMSGIRIKRLKKEKDIKYDATLKKWFMAGLCLIVIGAGAMTVPRIMDEKEAVKRGAYNLLSIQPGDIKAFNKIYPYDMSEKVPENPEGKIILFYKYGCPDCSIALPDLMPELKDKEIYYVSSQSEKGRELVKRFNITAVPQAVYIRDKDYFYVKDLVAIRNDGVVVTNYTNMRRLLELQESDRKAFNIENFPVPEFTENKNSSNTSNTSNTSDTSNTR